jgi:hypothetical protein
MCVERDCLVTMWTKGRIRPQPPAAQPSRVDTLFHVAHSTYNYYEGF